MQPGDVLDGKYRLVRQLRAGGMGAVYSATRVALGDTVAIKVILPSQDSAVNRARFLREAQAAARIQHPNVVRIFDFGADPSGMPYIVMEHLTGAPLDDEIRRTGAISLPRALRIFGQVCSAVDAGHRRGVLHRDLKPANVMLATLDDNVETVKVLDFGLARFTNVSDAMSLTTPGGLLGTYPYMPPELIHGGDATALSDVYSLGVILYELVTGRVPFAGASLMAVMQKIAAGAYTRPDHIVQGLPEGVLSAIAAALATDPERRPPSAASLASRAGAGPADQFEALGFIETAQDAGLGDGVVAPPEEVTEPQPIFPPPSGVQADDGAPPEYASGRFRGTSQPLSSDWPDLTRFVGRERELKSLNGEYDAALAGEGRLVVVVGEAGVGKSSLVREFGDRARASEASVLAGRFSDYEGSRQATYEPFIEMIRAARQTRGLEPDELSDSRVDVLLAALEGKAGATPLDDDGAKWRAWSAMAEELARLAARRPLVLAFDDLQWAGRHTLELLGFLQRALGDGRALVVCTARESDAQSSSGTELARWLIAQGRSRACSVLPVRPFTEDEVREWLSVTFGRIRLRPLDLGRIVRLTGGNPYYLFEMVRHLLMNGQVARSRDGWECAPLDRVVLPETVSNAVRSKLEGLQDAMRSVLEVAAVIGDEFRFETLQVATGLDEDALEGLVERAARQQILVETGASSPDDYRFHGPTIRRVLYEDMPARRRRRVHARVVEAIERVHADRRERLAGTLCYHHHAVGAWAEAFRWGTLAAEEALARHDVPSAESNAWRAREAAERLASAGTEPSAGELARLDLIAGTVDSRLGRAESAGKRLGAAVHAAEDAQDSALLAQALVELAQHQLHLGTHERALATAQRGAAVALAAGDRPLHLTARAVGGLVLTRIGRYDEATERFEALLSELRPSDPPTLRAHALRNLAWCFAKRGAFARADGLAQQALELARATKDLAAEQVVLSAIAAVHGESGDLEGALPFQAESLRLARALALRRREGIELANMGEMLCGLGRHDEAEKLLAEALAIFVEIGDRACEGDCRVNLGRVMLAAGRPAEAVAMLERGRELCEATGRLEYSAFAALEIGEARLRQGDAEGAGGAFERAREIFERLDYYALWRAHLGLARAAAREGRGDLALSHLDEAAALVAKHGIVGAAEIAAARAEIGGMTASGGEPAGG